MKRIILLTMAACCMSVLLFSQEKFNGIDVNLGNLYRISDAKSRSISAENFNGAKGAGGMATSGTGSGPSRDLGQGWKVSPSVVIKAKSLLPWRKLMVPDQFSTSG